MDIRSESDSQEYNFDKNFDIEPLKFNPITNQIDVPVETIKTFMLCFMAVIWRRVLVNTLLYSIHNHTKLDNHIMANCVKYNIFSESGIGRVLKPYIKNAIDNGYILPNVFNRNIYARKSIMLYKEALNIVRQDNRDLEIKFISNYAVFIFDEDNKQELEQEKKDITDAMSEFTIYGDDEKLEDKDEKEGIFDQLGIGEKLGIDKNNPSNLSTSDLCNCNLCTTVNNWDINPVLIFTEEHYEKIIMNGLLEMIYNLKI